MGVWKAKIISKVVYFCTNHWKIQLESIMHFLGFLTSLHRFPLEIVCWSHLYWTQRFITHSTQFWMGFLVSCYLWPVVPPSSLWPPRKRLFKIPFLVDSTGCWTHFFRTQGLFPIWWQPLARRRHTARRRIESAFDCFYPQHRSISGSRAIQEKPRKNVSSYVAN
jgi:hypothetical protein